MFFDGIAPKIKPKSDFGFKKATDFSLDFKFVMVTWSLPYMTKQKTCFKGSPDSSLDFIFEINVRKDRIRHKYVSLSDLTGPRYPDELEHQIKCSSVK